jgi:hypothetical protein
VTDRPKPGSVELTQGRGRVTVCLGPGWYYSLQPGKAPVEQSVDAFCWKSWTWSPGWRRPRKHA